MKEYRVCRPSPAGPVALAVLVIFLVGHSHGSLADDYQFETSTFMRDTTYRRPEHLAADSDPSGAEAQVNIAWERSHTGKWFIEEQRYGGDAVVGGIAKDDPITIERGLKILRWGFEQQQPDGSFNCPDSFHSTSFFVEAAAHACLLLDASPSAARYSEAIDWIKPRLLQAALWMMEPSVETQGRRGNAPYAHRRYLVAAAFGETGVLAGDSSLIEHSKDYILEGLHLQDPSGYNPEKGGYDCSYHAVGLIYAERYYDIVAAGELKRQLYNMLQKGDAWLASRVLPDGTIDPTGNTRTGEGQEKSRNGAVKTINYGSTYRSFYRWSLISGDQNYAGLANQVFAGEAIYKRQIGK